MSDEARPQIDRGPTAATVTKRLWPVLLLKGVVVLTGAGASVGLLLILLNSVTPTLLSVWALAYSIRVGVHVHVGYLREPGEHGPQLRALTWADLVVAATFDVIAIAFLAQDAPRQLIAALAAALFLAVLLISGATVRITRDTTLPRGSEWVRRTALVQWLEGALEPHRRLFGRPFLWAMRQATPVRDASCFVVCLLAILAAVAMAEGATSFEPVRTAFHIASDDAAADPADGQSEQSSKRSSSASGSTVGVPPPAATPSTAPTVPIADIDYPDACPGAVTPGFGAPPERAQELQSLWLGGGGVGGVVAGCAEPAFEEPGQQGVWLVRGMCGDELRGLGIAMQGAVPHLMLQQVARFAAEQARNHALLGASSRISVGSGDFQVVETTGGDYVLARRTSSNGRVAISRSGLPCDQLADANASYVEVSPGLVELWSQLIGDAWVWPVEEGSSGTGSTLFSFVRDGSDTTVGTASCAPDGACEMLLDGRIVRSSGDDRLAADVLVSTAQG